MTLDQDIEIVREAAHAEQPLQGQIDAADAALDRIQADNERLRWVVQTGLCLECGTHFRDMPVARAALEPKETQ